MAQNNLQACMMNTNRQEIIRIENGDSIVGPDSLYNRKHPWIAAGEVIGVNLAILGFDNYVLKYGWAKVSMKSIKKNIKGPLIWDSDKLETNFFAHPYNGMLYYNAARSNGMSFFASIPYTFAGTLMWEEACELEAPAINDYISTTLGGVCIGEVTHRLADMVLDDGKKGTDRLMAEAMGFLIDPIRGMNRLLTGKAWHVRQGASCKHHDYRRFPVAMSFSTGSRRMTDDVKQHATGGYVHFGIAYGDATDNSENKPYDYFTTDVTLGLGGK